MGPFIELANGDILPGIIAEAAMAGRTNEPPHFVSVVLSRPLETMTRDRTVRVRIDSVARVVLTETTGRPFTPGLTVYRDGRESVARRIKWASNGIRLLSARSVEFASWEQLAELHVPQAERVATILRDSAMPPRSDFDVLGRMTTECGAVLTYHCDRVFSTKVRSVHHHLVQPIWSDTGIMVAVDDIASISYRDVDGVPLSLLPAQTLAQHNLTGFTWRWQRNRNVRGQQLSVAGHSADLGVGTHSHSEVAFALPPGAVSFSSWVGIDDIVGRGGCVRCRVFRNRTDGDSAWASGIIRGGEKPVRVQVSDLAKADRLVLVTEFAHDNDRPADAEPFDINDAVSWLSPMVRVELTEHGISNAEFFDLFPPIRGWSLSESMRRRISGRTFFIAKEGRWVHSMVLDVDKPAGPIEPLVLTRDVDVNIDNAWLLVAPGRNDHGSVGHRAIVYADGEKVNGTEGYDGDTTGYQPGTFDRVAYSLGKYQGKRVTVTVRVNPSRDDPPNLSGIVWDELSLNPLIAGLPASGRPIEPDVTIESIDSLRWVTKKNSDRLAADVSSGDSPPTLRHFRMVSGLDIPPQIDSVTCQLDPRWKGFVACIGPAGQSRGAIQSFQVWVDEQLLWQSERFTRLSRPRQVVVRLPTKKAGTRLLLRVVNETNDHAAWANAGFMFNDEPPIGGS